MEFTYKKDHIYYEQEGKLLAEVLFPEGIITHTFVDESLAGQGIAAKLVDAAVESIEKEGKTPKATCSYAVKWLEKNR